MNYTLWAWYDSTCNVLNWKTYLCRYEDEINKRASVENEFVLLKKVKHLAAILIL